MHISLRVTRMMAWFLVATSSAPARVINNISMREFWIEFDIGVFAKISFERETSPGKLHYQCQAFLVPHKDDSPTEDDFAFSFSFSRSEKNWDDIEPVQIDSAFRQLVDLSEDLALDMLHAIKDYETNQPSHIY